MFPESYESRLFTIQMLECRHMPFSPEQFVEVFRQYNEAIWPTQWILYAVALGAVLLVLSSSARVGQIVSGALASLWVWMAVAYHFAFFAAINRAAMLFGVLFLIEAFLFVLIGVKRARLSFHVDAGGGAIVGACLILYALVVYPMVGYSIGHRYPAAPTFGVPCPTTIFTFGLLLWSDRRVSWALLVIPAAWSLLGLAAALSLGVVEDYGLPVAGILGTTLILLRNHRQACAPRSDRALWRRVNRHRLSGRVTATRLHAKPRCQAMPHVWSAIRRERIRHVRRRLPPSARRRVGTATLTL